MTLRRGKLLSLFIGKSRPTADASRTKARVSPGNRNFQGGKDVLSGREFAVIIFVRQKTTDSRSIKFRPGEGDGGRGGRRDRFSTARKNHHRPVFGRAFARSHAPVSEHPVCGTRDSCTCGYYERDLCPYTYNCAALQLCLLFLIITAYTYLCRRLVVYSFEGRRIRRRVRRIRGRGGGGGKRRNGRQEKGSGAAGESDGTGI